MVREGFYHMASVCWVFPAKKIYENRTKSILWCSVIKNGAPQWKGYFSTHLSWKSESQTKQENLKGLESENIEREKAWELEFIYGTQQKHQIKNPWWRHSRPKHMDASNQLRRMSTWSSQTCARLISLELELTVCWKLQAEFQNQFNIKANQLPVLRDKSEKKLSYCV